MNIDLYIDELVLHGFPTTDRARIAAAVERELARLLAERGVPSGWARDTDVAQLDGGSFQVAQGAPADAVGAQVAQTIYGGLSHE